MSKVVRLIAAIIRLLGLINLVDAILKKIMERVNKMGQEEDARVETAKQNLKVADQKVAAAKVELKEAQTAKATADKGVADEPEEIKDAKEKWIPGKKVKNKETGEITQIKDYADKTSVLLDNGLLLAVGSPEAEVWERV